MLGICLCCVSLGSSLAVWLRPDKAIRSLLENLHDQPEVSKELTEEEAALASAAPEEILSSLPSSDLEGKIEDLDTPLEALPENRIYDYITDSTLGPLIYYSQRDSRWNNYLYGGSDPIEDYGCGPTTVAMLISSFTSEEITPPEMADWAVENGQFSRGNGSFHSLIPKALSAYGFVVESVKDRSVEHVSALLGEGNILVALMGRGTFTDNGHFILITDLLDDQTVRIADPNSYENSTKKWQLSQLLSELKKTYDSGAPLWAVHPAK